VSLNHYHGTEPPLVFASKLVKIRFSAIGYFRPFWYIPQPPG
jgi:hypothetical protein